MSKRWTPPGGVLGRLCQVAERRAEALAPRARAFKRDALARQPGPRFEGALRGETVAVVAEFKRASPSKGALNPAMNVAEQGRAFVRGGAQAISVLTEPTEFGGSIDDLVRMADTVAVPILKKDFHVDPVQVWEAASAGASALLLIVRALGPDGSRRMFDTAGEAGVEVLAEVRDEWELEWALEAGARVVGVNRRNLETLAMEDDVHSRILPLVPRELLAIAESGIETRMDVEAVAASGADAVLVGSALSLAEDCEAAVRALTGVPRKGR